MAQLESRRTFLKAASAAASSTILASSAFAKSSAAPQINPDIDNMNVVHITDKTMGYGANAKYDKVSGNMDKLAAKLSGKAQNPWATIFRKPSGKDWKDVKVAIKPNAINSSLLPTPAILKKICEVFNGFGVPYTNITVYDTVAGNKSNAAAGKYNNGKLPDGVQLPSSLTWGTAQVPAPFNKSYGILNVALEADIIVNIAINKGHSGGWARVTLCMKNHFGTFDPVPFGGSKTPDTHASFDYLLAINKADIFIGGSIPKQQLCIVDSLYSGKNGPGGSADQQQGIIVMGTFAPAVDYLTAHKVRVDICKYTIDIDGSANDTGPKQQGRTKEFLESQGYSTTDPQWIDAGDVTISQKAALNKATHYPFTIAGNQQGQIAIRISQPGKHSIAVVDMNGKLVYSTAGIGMRTHTIGKMQTGRSGNFIAKISTGYTTHYHNFSIL